MKRATKSAAKLVVLENDDLIASETEQLQERVRERAYELSQQRGHAGRDIDDWLTAESEIISVPPAELIEKNGTFQVTLAILGINLQDVRILASADRLLVRGDYRYHRESDDGIVHLSDFRSATLFRAVQFPEPIDAGSMDIQLQDGVLRINASKASAAGARQEKPAAKRKSSRKAPAKKKKAS